MNENLKEITKNTLEKLKQRLEQNQNSIETRLYGELKKQLWESFYFLYVYF